MEVCKELVRLAKEVEKKGATLYLVGGYVRDSILGLKNTDIDITSSLSEESIIEICSKLNIKTNNINKHLGTIQLIYNNIRFEYTRFRKESYPLDGSHTPSNVEFVTDINVDTLRRDFTINSIYYDILQDEFVDITNGRKDIERKIIRTTNHPDITLRDDGVRILRAVRFSSLLNFKIEPRTLRALKKYTPLLKSISKERILKELNLSVTADLTYNRPNKNFLKFCNLLSLPKYMFNSSLSRMRKFSRSDINNFYALEKSSRLVGFYILILKNYFKDYVADNQLSFTINMLLGHNGIKESSNHIFTTEKIYKIYQNLSHGTDELNATVNYLTLSNAERNIIDNFLSKKAKQALSDKISFIKDKKLPLSVHELDICVQDILDLNIERKFISKILSTLYNQVLNMYVPNEKEALKNLALELHETFIKVSKEIL